MARLQTAAPERQIHLPARCLIGRSRACDLVLPERQVSAQHAAIEWTGARWTVRDLGSSNGTYLSGRSLEPGEAVALRRGDELRFGRDAPAWWFVDDAAPVLMGLSLATGAFVLADGTYLVLPDADHPELAVYQDSLGVWCVEAQGAASPIEDRAVHRARDALWRIYLPTLDGTLKQPGAALLLAALRLRFTYTRDEEHVELTVTTERRSFDLKARAHHYLLLLLARRRLADRRAGLPAAEQGWIRVEELLRMLRIDDNHLKISIHRARAQLGQIGVTDAAGLIERRPGTRQLRLGVEALELVTLDTSTP